MTRPQLLLLLLRVLGLLICCDGALPIAAPIIASEPAAAPGPSAWQRVLLAACDTFRAAAIEQLKIWGERTGSPVVSSKLGADAAGLAYDAYEKAKEAGSDVLIIDTAGRLQNKAELMAELEKIHLFPFFFFSGSGTIFGSFKTLLVSELSEHTCLLYLHHSIFR